jgi:PHD/YefM family antitoxin component YafN of YafNO toxin-antitoxin module
LPIVFAALQSYSAAMKSVSVQELGAEPLIFGDREMIVTKNGKPVGVLLSVTEDSLMQTLAAVRRARATEAVLKMQQQSFQNGRDQMSDEEIEREIQTVRAARRHEGRR